MPDGIQAPRQDGRVVLLRARADRDGPTARRAQSRLRRRRAGADLLSADPARGGADAAQPCAAGQPRGSRFRSCITPRRAVELFLNGAAGRCSKKAPAAQNGTDGQVAPGRGALLGFCLSACTRRRSRNRRRPIQAFPPTSFPPRPPMAMTDAPPAVDGEPSIFPATGPTGADVRPVPLAVRASHPELATVSPIEANAHDPHALDLQTCFMLTAVRDDSLKINMEDIEIARAQLSQSIAALWPTFTVGEPAAVPALQQFRLQRLLVLQPGRGWRRGRRDRSGHGDHGGAGQPHLRVAVERLDELHALQRRPELQQRRREQRSM